MPRLALDAIPQTTFWVNLRTADTRLWDIVRREAYRRADNRCVVCHAAGILHAHEVWAYDWDASVQWLYAVKALCPMCHACQHIQHTALRVAEGTLTLDAVVNHYCNVNGCTEADFWQDHLAAYGEYLFRSEVPWVVSVERWLREEGYDENTVERIKGVIHRRLADGPDVDIREY